MYKDFKELLSVLNANKVKYLIVGGYAVSLHAQPRATNDIDVLVQATVRNAKALFLALRDFGAPLEGIAAADLVAKGSFFRMGRPPLMVDILSEIDGVAFKDIWRNRVEVEIDPIAGLTAHFISAPDLIKAKTAAGRPKDLLDVEELKRAEAEDQQTYRPGPRPGSRRRSKQ